MIDIQNPPPYTGPDPKTLTDEELRVQALRVQHWPARGQDGEDATPIWQELVNRGLGVRDISAA